MIEVAIVFCGGVMCVSFLLYKITLKDLKKNKLLRCKYNLVYLSPDELKSISDKIRI